MTQTTNRFWTGAELNKLSVKERRELRDQLGRQRASSSASARKAAGHAISYLDQLDRVTREQRTDDMRAFLYPSGR